MRPFTQQSPPPAALSQNTQPVWRGWGQQPKYNSPQEWENRQQLYPNNFAAPKKDAWGYSNLSDVSEQQRADFRAAEAWASNSGMLRPDYRDSSGNRIAYQPYKYSQQLVDLYKADMQKQAPRAAETIAARDRPIQGGLNWDSYVQKSGEQSRSQPKPVLPRSVMADQHHLRAYHPDAQSKDPAVQRDLSWNSLTPEQWGAMPFSFAPLPPQVNPNAEYLKQLEILGVDGRWMLPNDLMADPLGRGIVSRAWLVRERQHQQAARQQDIINRLASYRR